MGHYTIDADPAELSNAETKFASLATELGPAGQGGALSRSHGNVEGWTGEAATAVLTEMGRIATGMTTIAPKAKNAHDAVRTFRIALQNAIDDDLVKLNTRWSDADDAYTTAVKKAGTTYDDATKPAGSGKPVSDDDRTDASNAKSKATTSAAKTRTATRTAIDSDYDALITSLQKAAKTCGDAMAADAPFTFTHEQWESVKGGGPIPVGLWREMRESALGKGSFVTFLDQAGGDEAEKPEWLDTAEKALKPLEATNWLLDSSAFTAFNSTAGGGVRDLLTNGKLWDLYEEDALRGLKTVTTGLTDAEGAGVGIGSGVKLMDGRALGPLLFSEGSKVGSLVGKAGVLGPISIGVGVIGVGVDIAHGDTQAAVHDGVATALTAGAVFAPPPVDLVCGGAALAMAAYDNIPAVHHLVDGVGHAVASGWHHLFG